MIICPICNKKLNDNMRFCDECGASLREAPAIQCAVCGAKLINGVCPNCSRPQQKHTQQISYTPSVNDVQNAQNGNQQSNQNAYNAGTVCAVCGGEMINGVCTICNNKKGSNTIPKSGIKLEYKLKNLFMSPDEALVATLGNTYISNFLNSGELREGYVFATDKRVYFHGTSYEITYNSLGERKMNKNNMSRIVDLKDITGIGYDHMRNIGYVIAIILYAIIICLGLYRNKELGDSDMIGGKWMLVIPVLVLYFLYRASMKSFFTIQYAGGGIAFDMCWFQPSEIIDFQRQLCIAKDKAVENTYDVMASKFTKATNMQYTQEQHDAYKT